MLYLYVYSRAMALLWLHECYEGTFVSNILVQPHMNMLTYCTWYTTGRATRVLHVHQQFRVCSSAASDGQSCELHSSHPQKGSDTCVARTTLTFYISPHVDRGNGEHSRKGAEGHAEAYRGQDCRLGYWESYRGEVQRRECKRCLLSEARRKTFSRQAKSARRHAARFRVVPQFQHASPLFSHGNAMMYTCSLFGLEFRDRIKIADTR
eukprot:30453-Pelagococcus_subviridis.AAC.5